MSLSYLKNLLTGGVGSVATVGTGVTGWKLHQETNLTVEGVFNRMGYKTSPVKSSEVTHKPTTTQVFTWKARDCVNRLFPGVTVNHELVSDDSSADGTEVASVTPQNTSDNDMTPGVGCLSMQLHPWKDTIDASRLYFQMELALRKGEMGVVLWTAMSHGKLQGSAHSSSFDFYHRMILLEKKSGQWKVMGGYEWIDYSVITNFNEEANFITIKAPDGRYLLNKKLINSMTQSDQWIGVWEESTVGKHPLRDIDIQIGTTSGGPPDYELYGIDNAFDAQHSTHKDAGYKNIVSYYDPTISKWKKAGSNRTGKNKSDTLKAWYKPFQGKGGQWTEIGKACKSLNDGPRHKWTSAGWRKDVCFEKVASRT